MVCDVGGGCGVIFLHATGLHILRRSTSKNNSMSRIFPDSKHFVDLPLKTCVGWKIKKKKAVRFIMINACLSSLSKESIDITNIIDVELVSKGCHGCCYSTIMVYDSKQVCPNKIIATKASHLSQLLVHAANV